MNTSPTTAAQSGIIRAISREEMAKRPIQRFEGDVYLVTTPHDLERAIADIRRESVVGFDTETRPSFAKGETHLPCLVQVATARAVYLFPLRNPQAFEVLGELLMQSGIVKVGGALANDLRQLKLLFSFVEKNILGLGIFSRPCGLRRTGLRTPPR